MTESVPIADRILEILAVLLLGITTVGTAWCGYQASQWSEASDDQARVAADQHVEGARLFGAAMQRVSYDSMLVAQYAQARAEGKENLLRFYRETLVRPAFLPVLQRWEAEVQQGRAPVGLAEDKDYQARSSPSTRSRSWRPRRPLAPVERRRTMPAATSRSPSCSLSRSSSPG